MNHVSSNCFCMLLYINLVLQITLIAVALLGAIAFSSFIAPGAHLLIIVPYHVSHFIFIYKYIMQVLIFVKTVTSSATIGNVKEKIKYKESILSDQQHLIHLGRLQLLGVHPPSRVQDRRWFICRRPLAARPWSLRIKTRRSLCHSSSATGCISSSISGLLGSSARPALPFLPITFRRSLLFTWSSGWGGA